MEKDIFQMTSRKIILELIVIYNYISQRNKRKCEQEIIAYYNLNKSIIDSVDISKFIKSRKKIIIIVFFYIIDIYYCLQYINYLFFSKNKSE